MGVAPVGQAAQAKEGCKMLLKGQVHALPLRLLLNVRPVPRQLQEKKVASVEAYCRVEHTTHCGSVPLSTRIFEELAQMQAREETLQVRLLLHVQAVREAVKPVVYDELQVKQVAFAPLPTTIESVELPQPQFLAVAFH